MEPFLYQKIYDDLKTAVLTGHYSPGDRIPSENELADRYHASRGTVRKALRILEGEGILKPQQGSGYLVLSPEYTRFSLQFSDNPAGSSVKYLSIDVIPADMELEKRLDIDPGRMLVVTRRLLLQDGKPTAYDEKYVPYLKGDPVIERELHYSQFPDTFTDRYVPRTIWTEMEIDAAQAPEDVCRALMVPARTEKLLRVCRTILTGERVPVGFGRRWYPNGILRAVSDYEAERM